MKAIVQNRYGSPDVLELKEIAAPVLRDDDVLLRVVAASVNASRVRSTATGSRSARSRAATARPTST